MKNYPSQSYMSEYSERYFVTQDIFIDIDIFMKVKYVNLEITYYLWKFTIPGYFSRNLLLKGWEGL